MTVSGAYGRDYTSAKKALEDWKANKDFLIRGREGNGHTVINLTDAERIPGLEIWIRYDADTKKVLAK
jgi:hypothetical protein